MLLGARKGGEKDAEDAEDAEGGRGVEGADDNVWGVADSTRDEKKSEITVASAYEKMDHTIANIQKGNTVLRPFVSRPNSFHIPPG